MINSISFKGFFKSKNSHIQKVTTGPKLRNGTLGHDVASFELKKEEISEFPSQYINEKKSDDYLSDFNYLSGIKNEKGEPTFNVKYVDENNSVFITKPDVKLITDVLDLKYGKFDCQKNINQILENFINGKLNRSELNKNIYMLKNGHSELPADLKRKPEDFFIKIDGYKKNLQWAKYMCASSELATMKIKDGVPFKEVIGGIAHDLNQWDINNITNDKDFKRALMSGKLRRKPDVFVTPFRDNGSRYGSYNKKFAKFILDRGRNSKTLGYEAPKQPEGFPTIETAMIQYNFQDNTGKIFHPVVNSDEEMVYCEDIYNNLIDKYSGKKLSTRDVKNINKKIAKMHWAFSHIMPYQRGSDGIVNAFIKSLYSALGIQTFPPAKGISFDLEAFCTELDVYVKKYQNFYEQPSKYVLKNGK